MSNGVMALILLPVLIVLLVVAYRYREKGPNWHQEQARKKDKE